MKEKLGVKLFNEDARLYGDFMNAYSSVSGKLHHSGSLDAIKQADGIIVLGTRIATDNPMVRYAIRTASQHNGAKVVYAHPLEDTLMKNTATQFMKYEAGSEEGVMALLAHELLANADLDEAEKKFIDDLDLGYIEAESNIGDDEIKEMRKAFARTQKHVLVLGSDLFAHSRAKNIAKLAALIEKYSDYSLVIVPNEANTVGVSLICDLDTDEETANIVGYNAKGDFVLSSLDDADLAMPALNQVEGTIVNIDNKVLPLNVALTFNGYVLNDLANAVGINKEYTIEYTRELPVEKGFKQIDFDSLENFYSSKGEDIRGYLLDEVKCETDSVIEPVDELPEYNGTVVYHCNPVLQFNEFTYKTKQLEKDTSLRGSAQFAAAAKINDGDEIEINFKNSTVKRKFKLDEELKGTIALNPVFDTGLDSSSYRFEKSKIVRVV
jgi:NADH-quinone oxidoreductase subunit G